MPPKGNFAKMCFRKKKGDKSVPKYGRNVNSVNNDNVDDEDYFGVHTLFTTPAQEDNSTITAVTQCKDGLLVYVDVSMDSGNIPFLADTGSPIDIISENTYKANFKSYNLRQAEKPSYGYGPNVKNKVPIPILGVIRIKLRSNDKEITSQFHVLQGHAMNLLTS